LRSLEYERIDGLVLKGLTLDIGGGRAFDYYPLLRPSGSIHSVNLNRQRNPSAVADLNSGFPFTSNSYDTVISFNTFEHIRRDTYALREMLRILKPTGRFHLLVPFLHRIHAAPADYHRHSAYWWIDFFAERASLSVEVEPLVWSPIASACAQFGWFRGRRGVLLKRLVLLAAVFTSRNDDPGAPRMSLPEAERCGPYALGYYIQGTK
jgi:SAM-dependent methyltransferase